MNLELQNNLLNVIKSNLPGNISFVDELSDVLQLSKDSTYRRIRGETLLNIQEIQRLVHHFNLSLDNILDTNQNRFSFESKSIDLKNFTISEYLKSILKNLNFLSQLDNNRIIYSARDIPIFHYFMIPELSIFKIFCWLKTYLNAPGLEEIRFDPDHLPDLVDQASSVGQQVWKKYIHLPSAEIWTNETIIVTLRQVNYYNDAGLFSSPAVGKMLLAKFRDLLQHIQKQAERGVKYDPDLPLADGAAYDLYYSEVAQGDNSVLFNMGGKKVAFITYCTLNYLTTSNEKVCNSLDYYFTNLIKTSILLSRNSQKERNKFFNKLIDQLEFYNQRI